MESEKSETTEMEVEDDDVIDEEQLEEYQEMVDQLGTFPDKVKINGLSMVAEDHSESKQSTAAIYECIRKPLVSPEVSKDRKLSLVYVVDSILKNVGAQFIPLVEGDAKNWLPLVYKVLPEDQAKKLKRVWNMWRDAKLFSEANWKEMGECFSAPPLQQENKDRAADGTLQLPVKLRKEMQAVLDDMQSTITNELDKVSLERLADINPSLLAEIKKTAQDVLSSGQSGVNSGGGGGNQSHAPSFLVETRSPEWIARSNEWRKLKQKNPVEEAEALITNLQQYESSKDVYDATFTQPDAIQMTNVLAASSVTASLLSKAIQQLQEQEKENSAATETPIVRRFLSIDKALFTNDGLKQKNETVIGSLYEAGLPHYSAKDGKRFSTETELSKHLDVLFKKKQDEKSKERNDERQWYEEDLVWTGQISAAKVAVASEVEAMDTSAGAAVSDAEKDPSTFTMHADESRDRCVICGINFKMVFDNNDGIYVYTNCREIEVLNDDAAEKESESMLVHVTCWRGLGSPDVLTSDQALQETEHHY